MTGYSIGGVVCHYDVHGGENVAVTTYPSRSPQ